MSGSPTPTSFNATVQNIIGIGMMDWICIPISEAGEDEDWGDEDEWEWEEDEDVEDEEEMEGEEGAAEGAEEGAAPAAEESSEG